MEIWRIETCFTYSSLLKLHYSNSKGLQTHTHTQTHTLREKKEEREIQIEMVGENKKKDSGMILAAG